MSEGRSALLRWPGAILPVASLMLAWAAPLPAQDSSAIHRSLYRQVVLRVAVANDTGGGRYNVARALPPVETQLRRTESLTDFVNRRYAAAATGVVRDSVVTAINQLNRNRVVQREIALADEQVMVPLLPRMDSGLTEKDVTWPVSRYRLQAGPGRTVRSVGSHDPDEHRRSASTGQLIEIQGTEPQIEALLQAYRDSGVQAPATVPYATLQIHWESDALPPPDADPVLRDAERAIVRKLVAEPKRVTYVVVLDSGWPSQGARDSSVALLYDVLDRVRGDDLLGLPRLPRPNLGAFAAPTNTHCETIAEALEEFVALDSGKAVQVLYVPLSREQNAKQVLQDLIETQYLIQIVRNQQRIPSRADHDRVRRQAEDALAGVPARVGATGEVFLTSTAIVSAVYYVFDELARLENGYHFVNESWTVTGKTMLIAFPSPTRVLGVAAVGNVPQRDVLSAGIDFSGRSLQHLDHLAVLNMDRQGALQCSSSTVGEPFLERVLAVAFDGRVGSRCGTSFAAPRVAWLLAAIESSRNSGVGAHEWALRLQLRLVSARSNRQGIPGLWLDLWKLTRF